jgi:hypothetical protein
LPFYLTFPNPCVSWDPPTFPSLHFWFLPSSSFSPATD